MEMELLPDDCLGHIFSFSSPLEACRMCLVSRAAQSTMDSDIAWEKFLPSDYKDIVSRLVYPVKFSTKKELFFKLCEPQLIDNGTKKFWLDNRTGKKCYVLGARELFIAWSNHPLYWSWKPSAGSRFAEAVELRTIWWLEIQGSIKCSSLSPNTTYRVSLIVQIADRAYGLDKLPSEITIEIGKHKVQTSLYLSKPSFEKNNESTKVDSSRLRNNKQNQIRMREDGMVEIILGEFYNNGNDEEVKMSLREVKGVHLKGGLIVEGMEIRAQYYERVFRS